MTNVPEVKDFDPSEIVKIPEFPITKYQPLYFIANNFEDAKLKIRYIVLAGVLFILLISSISCLLI